MAYKGLRNEPQEDLSTKQHEVSKEKLQFYKIQVKYVVIDNGLTLDSDRTQGIFNFPIAKTKRQLRRFLGLGCYCRKWIPNFLSWLNIYTLFSRLNRQRAFTWTEESHKAFKEKKAVFKILLL